ncbi:hypothetical protein [Amycolatopsis sp. NPDC021455]|uniref:hypothetical protein n=1 Tax=Amycolatopsis sp. NPDC021455 TaxID=3154901 RepID=UPI0033DBB331
MPRRELRPDQVWLIGVPLNLLLAIPCAFPVALGMFGLQILAGELGLAEAEAAGEADVKILFGLVAFLLAGLVVFGLNALFAFRAPQLKAGPYWLAVALLIIVPDVLYWTVIR